MSDEPADKDVDQAVLKELEGMYALPNDETCVHTPAGISVTWKDGTYTLHCKHCGRVGHLNEEGGRRLGWSHA